MTVVVMKFGGSCLVDNNAFKQIDKITNIYSDAKKVYVASAFKGITDLLIATANSIDEPHKINENMALIEKRHMNVIQNIFQRGSDYYEAAMEWVDEKLSELEEAFSDIEEFGLEPYYKDYVSSFGEILSTYILNQYLLSRGHNSIFISANNLIITDDNFNNAYPLYELTNNRVEKRILPLLENPKKDTISCVTGYIGRNKIGYITTLGRGGSDYTATILARALYERGSDKDIKVILWKDVDGLLAIDPQYVPEAALIKRIDYAEAKEIANFGAQVLHPKCLEAIEKKRIALEIRNFDQPEEEENYTVISDSTDISQIKGVSALEDASIITITSGSMVGVPGILARIFKVMGEKNISVSLVSQSSSEVSTSFIVSREDLDLAMKSLRETFRDFLELEFFEINSKNVGVLNITGLKVLDNSTRSRIFEALDKNGIEVKALSQSYDELNLSLVIEDQKLKRAIKTIHDDLCHDIDNFQCADTLRKRKG
ncbi:MAG: aspartate kinase [Promethearchaeia archaeon]